MSSGQEAVREAQRLVGEPSTTSVFCRLSFVGIHYWPNAPKEVGWLGARHRHQFEVEVEVPVAHHDRDIEFQLLKAQVKPLIHAWGQQMDSEVARDYGTMSCEDFASRIATAVLGQYTWADWCQVTVSEDGENGARVLEVR